MSRAVATPRTEDETLPFKRQPNTEPIPGYRLLAPIGTGGFGEVWRCEAPGGLLKAIKFVYGQTDVLQGGAAPAEEELRAIQRVKAIRHPFLLSMERVEVLDGELVIVLELADMSLNDLLTEYQDGGKPGLPRDDLLGYLRETAEALDLMNIQYDLQHLDIKPRNLFLVCHHVKVGDFGLVNSLGRGEAGRPTGLQLGAITPRYASPEVFQGSLSRFSDQYSLAVVYQELLTGRLPFNGKNSRQLLLQHLKAEPDLDPLPDSDRAVVARALAKDPADRFPSCADFVRALQAGAGGAVTVSRPGGGDQRPAARPGTGEDSKETINLGVARGDTVANRAPAPVGSEALAGYRLQSCLTCTPLTEVWKGRAPDGRERLVKILYGFTPSARGRGDEEKPLAPGGRGVGADFLARLEALRHPVLQPIDILHSAPGRLVLACDPPARTLRDRCQECQGQGLPGIPRRELLGYLRTAAEALTFLYQQHAIQHLGLHPRNLLLTGERLRIADFGLLQLLWLPAGQPLNKVNARYSAPELLQKQIHPSCDQYSLALIYHEMLIGAHARRGPGDPSGDLLRLDRLPAADRAVLARALDPNPQRRWSSCVELVQALETGAAHGAEEFHSSGVTTVVLPASATQVLRAAGPATPAPDATPTADGAGLQTKFTANLPLGVIRLRLDGFRQQWNGQVVHEDDLHFVFQLKTPASVWQRWLGRQPGLEVHLRLACPPVPSAPAEVAVEIRPHESGRKQSAELVKVVGPVLLESLRTYLQVNPKRRTQERFVWRHPLEARPVLADGSLGEVIACQGKDISLNGIGFYAPEELPTDQVRLQLPQTPQTPNMTVPVRVVRTQKCSDGWVEIGAVLLPPEPAAGEEDRPG